MTQEPPVPAQARTLYDKVWDCHVVKSYEDGTDLIYVDRHLVHEISSPQAFSGLETEGRALRRPNAHLSVADHAVPTLLRDLPLPPGLAASSIMPTPIAGGRFEI